MAQKKYDIILFGATSFVGQILTRYLITQYGTGGDLRFAAAARSMPKLESLRTGLGAEAAGLNLIVADAGDEKALQQMCKATKVVVSTVGPYALYGEPLVKVCAESGTDYCDLTGEVQWIKRMIDRYEGKAQASGARIVHCCGFDSIPSDMGVFFLQQQAQATFGDYCSQIKMRVRRMRGEFSGGTVASLLNVVKEASKDPQLRKELANPYLICPLGHGFSARQNNINGPQQDPDFDCWVAPFVMSAINTRIVHRSNALGKSAYGDHFLYDEAMMMGTGIAGAVMAYGLSAAMGAFMMGAVLSPTRWVLENFIVPKPGQGPSEESQQNGYYDIRFFGKTDNGKTLQVKVYGDQDPGYGSTSKMLGQAAVCLAQEIAKKDMPGGFWTPSTVFGDHLLKRLQEHSGLTFEVL